MKILFRRLLWSLTVLVSVSGFGQNYLQNFTAPTANGYAFSKIDNVQMSPFTGRLNFSIPLFQKKLSQLSCNVSLLYTGGGGISYYDPGSIVTKGWQLSGGGAVIRHIRGVPDDYKDETGSSTMYNGVMYNPSGVVSMSDGDQRISTSTAIPPYQDGDQDGQHDIFEFSYPGGSGKFYIGKDKQVVVVPQSKIKVQIVFDTTGHPGFQIGSFKVTDEAGIKYFFNKPEYVFNIGNTSHADYAKTWYGKKYPTTWLLTKIETTFGEESILYEYEADKPGSTSVTYDSYENNYYVFSRKTTETNGTMVGNVLYQGVFDHYRLKNIGFSDKTRIFFNYKNTGADLLGPTDNALRKLELYDSTGRFLDAYLFHYNWGSDANGWGYTESEIWGHIYPERKAAHLYSLSKINKDSAILPYCAFTYNLVNGKNEEAYSDKMGVDYWGYHNGKDNYQTKMIDVSTQWGTADRSPVLSYAQVGTLKAIYYATGGWEEFEYELNDKKVSSSNVTVGGIRLKKRVLHDNVSSQNDLTKEYKYIGTDGLSSGFADDLQFNYSMNTYWDNSGWPSSPSIKYTRLYGVSHAVNPVSMIEGSHVGYRRVEELIKNGSSYNGKIVYEYTDRSYAPIWPTQEVFPYRPMDRATWAVGLPLRMSIYNTAGALVKKTENEWNIYASQVTEENYRSLYIAKKGEVEKANPSPQPNLRPEIFRINNYYPVTGRVELAKTKEYTYPTISGQPEVLVTTRYTYDATTYLLRSTFTYKPNGDSIETITRYSFDYDFSSNPSHAIKKMVDSNMLRASIATETWANTPSGKYLAGSSVTEYGFVNGSQIRPIKEYRSSFKGLKTQVAAGTFNNTTILQSGHNMQEEISVISYDIKGRRTGQTGRGGSVSGVIVDSSYNVIAKAANAISNEIYHYSFEELNGFDSNITRDSAKSHTGSYSGKIVNGTSGEIVSHSNTWLNISLAAPKKFVYSGWIYSTGPSAEIFLFMKRASEAGYFSYVDAIATSETGKWIYLEKEFIVPADVTKLSLRLDNNSSGTVWFDDVRLYPKDALMTTYTFNRLGNITSETDINNRSIFYDYDGFNRLKTIRDKDGNIVKTNEYILRPFYTSAAQSGSFTPGCPDHYVPAGNVTYNVPAGKYTSLISTADATAKAVHDLNKMGYFYATDHGTCLPLYYNVEMSQTFTKNNCPNDYYSPGGTNVVYTVPQYTYSTTVSQAAANAMAANDIAANGQNYANTNGVCLWRLNVDIESWGYDGQIIFEKTMWDPDPLIFDVTTGPSWEQDVVVPMGTYARVMVVTNYVGGGYCRVHMGNYTPWDVYYYGSTAEFTNVWIYDWYWDSNDILISPF